MSNKILIIATLQKFNSRKIIIRQRNGVEGNKKERYEVCMSVIYQGTVLLTAVVAVVVVVAMVGMVTDTASVTAFFFCLQG